MSVLPLKADIRQREWHVRYVPIADIHESLVAIRRQAAVEDRQPWKAIPGKSAGASFDLSRCYNLLAGVYYPDRRTKAPRTFNY